MSQEPAGTASAARGDAQLWQGAQAVRHAQRRTQRVLIVSQIIGSLGMGAAPSVGVLLAGAVAGSESLAGLARTASTVGAALAGIPLAAIAVRYGRRPALSGGWALAGVGAGLLVLAASVGSVMLLVVGMSVMGVGSATTLQARFAATDLAMPAHAGRALSVVVWAGSLGAVLGPNLGSPGEWVSARLDLEPLAGAFVLAAGLLLLAAVAVWLWMRPDPVQVARSHDTLRGTHVSTGPRALAAALVEAWRGRDSRLALTALVCAQAAMIAVMTMTPVHMEHHGATVSLVGITISVHVLGMFGLAPLMGWLTDRIGPPALIAVGQVVLLSSVVVSVVGAASVPAVMVALFLLGLGWSCATVPAAALLSRSTAPGRRTVTQGLSDTAMNTMAALAAGVSGPAMVALGFGGLAIGAGALCLPVLVLLVWHRGRTRPKRTVAAAP